jgi:predicted 3-demethylubiquinone-9 3-methyltransferase (glyoxalase superfamily)
MTKPAKNTICLWYDGDAEDAARFYAKTFPDSSVGAVHRAPGDYPSGKKGDVLTVEFIVMGIPCLGLNGGPASKHTEAFSFQVAIADQAETDRYWNAIVGNGGEESECGWCKWGLSWQITPIALTKAVTGPDPAAAKRAFDAMMQMKKIDIAAIGAARRGCILEACISEAQGEHQGRTQPRSVPRLRFSTEGRPGITARRFSPLWINSSRRRSQKKAKGDAGSEKNGELFIFLSEPFNQTLFS